MRFGFNTEWTRLSDSQKQGRTKGMRSIVHSYSANHYNLIGPSRIRHSTDKRDLSLYIRERSAYERRDIEHYSFKTIKFIKVNGKEIF